MSARAVIRALVLDFDGLVVETEWPELAAWQHVFERHGARLRHDEWSDSIGTVGALDPLALLAERSPGPLDLAEAEQRYQRLHDELVDATVVQPGVVDLLDATDRLELPVAIASSSSTAWIERHLDRLHLRRRFAAIASRDDVGVPKPAPDVYLAAVARLGVAPADAVAFEDSRHGVLAAKAAGLACVAVPTPMTRHLDLSDADLVVGSLTEVDLAALLTALVSRG